MLLTPCYRPLEVNGQSTTSRAFSKSQRRVKVEAPSDPGASLYLLAKARASSKGPRLKSCGPPSSAFIRYTRRFLLWAGVTPSIANASTRSGQPVCAVFTSRLVSRAQKRRCARLLHYRNAAASVLRMDFNASRWRSIDGSAYEFDERTSGGATIRVRGGGMSQVLRAKFVLVGGMPRLMGLESDGDAPLTARQLREPRIPEMEAAFAAYLDQDRRNADEQSDLAKDLLAQEDLSDEEAEDRHGTVSVIYQIRESRERWLGALDSSADVKVAARGRGSSPPSEGELRAFAAAFTRQQAAGRGAASRTAREIGMNRSTVYRWIEICRDRGLLPPREGN